jgi:hypothetical protein
MCDIQPSDVVAVWGAGPVAQFGARVLGAAKVMVSVTGVYGGLLDKFPALIVTPAGGCRVVAASFRPLLSLRHVLYGSGARGGVECQGR